MLEMHYKDLQDIMKQLSVELNQFKYLHIKRITTRNLYGEEHLRYQSLIYSIPNLLGKIKSVDKINFNEKKLR